jgi:hypothetical protein
MLILSVASKAAAASRITETLIGTAAGLIAGFVLRAPQVEPTEVAQAYEGTNRARGAPDRAER